jgi:hypothetical protein
MTVRDSGRHRSTLYPDITSCFTWKRPKPASALAICGKHVGTLGSCGKQRACWGVAVLV